MYFFKKQQFLDTISVFSW